MEKRLFEEMERLGFGQAMKRQVKLRIDVAGPHFGASEHRKILGYDVKFLATLYHDRKEHLLHIRSYDVIDLSVRMPEHRRTEIKTFDDAMKAINWDSPHFAWQHKLSGVKDDPYMHNIASIEEGLKNLAVRDIEYFLEVERLKLKYMYDSLYGIRHSLDGTSGDKYNQHFNMLSIDRKSGLCSVRDAVFLVCRCNINNYQPQEVIKAAITTRMEHVPLKPPKQHREVQAAIHNPLGKAV